MDWPSEPCLLEGLSAAEYHADHLGDVPTLSRSVAHTLITASPKHAAAEHPRLIGTAVRKQSDEMDLGTLVHALLLGGLEGIDVHDVPDWRGKRADLRDASRAAGQTPIKLGEFEKAVAAVEILKPEICRALGCVVYPCPSCKADGRACTACGGSGCTGRPAWNDLGRELVCLYEEMTPCGPVRVRQRWDLYWAAAGLLADPKVAAGGAYAKAAPFIRQLQSEENSGAMQAASYLRGHSAVHPALAGRDKFVFLRLEPCPPYCVVPIPVVESLRRIGEMRWERAINRWAECMAAQAWPPPGVAFAQAESWSLQRELDRMPEQEGADVDRGGEGG